MASRRPPGQQESNAAAWLWSIAIGTAVGALVMAYSFWWMPWVHGQDGWIVSNDIWILTEPARYVADGAFGYLYSARNGYYSLPLPALLMAPAVRLYDHWQMVGGYPRTLPKPTAWLVVGPWATLAAIPVLHAWRRLTTATLRRPAATALQVTVAAVVVVPCEYWCHPEDLLALAFLLYSLGATGARRWDAAAWLLAVAVCAKQWSIVALPFLIVAAPAGRRRRVLLEATGPALMLAAVPLAVDWSDASRSLLFPPTALHVGSGHSSLILPLLSSLAGHHASLVGRALEVVAAPVAALVVRHRPAATQTLALAGVLMLRMFLEPVVFAYYLAPGVAVLILAAVQAGPAVTRRVVAGTGVLMVWALIQSSRTGWWWAGVAVIVVALTASAGYTLSRPPATARGATGSGRLAAADRAAVL
ncbi:MAG: hypothetical protein KGQ66_12950 [Acidobacteriota bacterium]|nr:hypothetical protein [Acidobacteriota bacterium]